MYNKLFTKILDSSIWLAPDPHRLVWITLLAAMDEDGNVMFASAANVAARARVTLEAAKEAIAAFEAPDPDSGDPDNEGRRIERFPGGWHVLNAAKYRALVTKAIIREQTRQRVARFRQKSSVGNADVTHAKRTHNAPVTPSEALALALAEAKEDSVAKATGAKAPAKLTPEEIIFAYGVPLLCSAGTSEKQARSFLGGLRKGHGDDAVVDALRECLRAKPLQPLEWLAAALKPKPAGKQTALESRNAAVVARLIKEASSATK